MSEELDIGGMLERLKAHGLSPIERVLAGHTGTVQLMLSLWFDEQVSVISRSQEEVDGWVERRVDLVLSDHEDIVCEAYSRISLRDSSPDVVARVRERKLGIGQIAVALGLPTRRSIRAVEVTPAHITRHYDMHGPGLLYRVTERFPRERLRG